nr:MFS transporter [Jiangella gansuensis]
MTTAQPAVPDAQAPRRTNWLVVAATGVAVFMAQLDTTVVNVALPTIENDFGIGTSLTQWIVLGYVLPMIALSLPSGRWLNGVGHRNALVFAVAGFVLTSMAVGLAPSIGWLIAARVLQGAFAAVLFALIPVLTTVTSRPDQRGRAMGIVMTLGPLGGVSGPVLGGLLVEHAGWQWIFYLNVPVGLIVIAIGLTQLPSGSALRLPGRGFLGEIALLATAAVALMLSLTFTAEYGPGWLVLAPLALPFVLLWYRHPSSGTVRELLRAPGMLGPHLVLVTEMTAVMVIAFLVPFHLQRAAGATPAEVGLTMLAFPLATMAFGLIGGALADRFTPRRVTGVGAVVVTLGVTLMVPLAQGWGMAELSWRLAVIGVGAGLLAGPNQTMAMNHAPRHLMGTTGASTSLVRQIGIAFGPALATTLWALPGYTITGMRLAMGTAAVLAALSVLALVRTPRLDDDRPPSSRRR